MAAALSFAMMFFGVPLGAQSPCHAETSNPGNRIRAGWEGQVRRAVGTLW